MRFFVCSQGKKEHNAITRNMQTYIVVRLLNSTLNNKPLVQ